VLLSFNISTPGQRHVNFVITSRLLSVSFSHFNILLQNCFTKFCRGWYWEEEIQICANEVDSSLGEFKQIFKKKNNM